MYIVDRASLCIKTHSQHGELHEKSSSPSRVTSFPTFNSCWLPRLTTDSLQPRNSLGPLDLASSLPITKAQTGSPQKSSPTTPKHTSKLISSNSLYTSPRRHMPLVTPPLTPSSSFASSGGNDLDGDSGLLLTPPSEPASPCPVRFKGGLPSPYSLASEGVDLSSQLGSLSITSHDDDETPKAEKTLRRDTMAQAHDLNSLQAELSLLFGRTNAIPTQFIAVCIIMHLFIFVS